MSHPTKPKPLFTSAEPKHTVIRIKKPKEYPFDSNSERQKKSYEKQKKAEMERQPNDYIAEDTLNRRLFNIRRYERNQESLKGILDKKKANQNIIYSDDVDDNGIWSNDNNYDSDLEERVRRELERMEIREEIRKKERKKELEIIKGREKKIDLLSILADNEKRRLKMDKKNVTNKIIGKQIPPNLIKKKDDKTEIVEFEEVKNISESIEKIQLKKDNVNLEKEKVLKEEEITLLEEYDKFPFPETALECIIFRYPQDVSKFKVALQNKRNMYKDDLVINDTARTYNNNNNNNNDNNNNC
ncbi:MAG: hypothetical protein LBB45_00410 [Methanobrevibacter sp.]|jgi:hypothetical protein|nr:hypothetical protein [Candidatus Methanovirga basalitermitum]